MYDKMVTAAMDAASKARAALSAHDDKRAVLVVACKQAEEIARGLSRLVDKALNTRLVASDPVPKGWSSVGEQVA